MPSNPMREGKATRRSPRGVTRRPRAPATRTQRGLLGRSFGEWLRVELRSRRMSQRQLASRSGVSNATISRILAKTRDPSLGTALELTRAVLELGGGRGAEHYLGVYSVLGATSPATRVERALRTDESLDDARIRSVMDFY